MRKCKIHCRQVLSHKGRSAINKGPLTRVKASPRHRTDTRGEHPRQRWSIRKRGTTDHHRHIHVRVITFKRVNYQGFALEGPCLSRCTFSILCYWRVVIWLPSLAQPPANISADILGFKALLLAYWLPRRLWWPALGQGRPGAGLGAGRAARLPRYAMCSS